MPSSCRLLFQGADALINSARKIAAPESSHNKRPSHCRGAVHFMLHGGKPGLQVATAVLPGSALAPKMESTVDPPMPRRLTLDVKTLTSLFRLQGPSLGLWRAAEIAVFKQCELSRPILDLGCGDGLVSSMVFEHLEAGLDPDREALSKAEQLGIYGELENASVEQSKLPEDYFATIISNSVLEHIRDLKPVLGKAWALLQPGGRLVFTVPTEQFSKWLALPSARYSAWRNRQLSHLNLWSESRWQQTLKQSGFEMAEVRPYLKRRLVVAWDLLELAQQPNLARRRLFGIFWRRLPAAVVECLARAVSRLDLASPAPGGGRLIVAHKAVWHARPRLS